MNTPILSTKLLIPPSRLNLVTRTRLINKLNHGLDCCLILVSAPAGYGKTTLLSAWLDQLDCGKSWLLLDEGDNDPSRLLSYLLAAIQKAVPSLQLNHLSLPDLDDQADPGTVLNPLINQLSQHECPICLVMDDFHSIQNPAVHRLIGYLVENHPPCLHLVIGTRADPPLPLAKLRAKSAMLELRQSDLRFSFDEATEFLNHTMGLRLNDRDIKNLTHRTEGWVAGLQMAALSIQNADDGSAFISSFTGSQHFIFDYLLEEILRRQSAEIYHFLLYTSILDQLSAPLCDALMASDDLIAFRASSVILEELEHANLFIVPMDHEQHWYRYHPLFTELLRGYLQKHYPDRISRLHTCASDWFEEQGLISDAIRHAFTASDWERIVRLVSANVFALLEQNELNRVARQLDNLPGDGSSARPWLLIGRAWLAAYTGQLNAVEPILKLVESDVGTLQSEVELQTFGGHVAAIRAYIYWIGYKRDLAANAARVALEWLPADERLIRCQAATLLGLTLSDYEGRTRALRQALEYTRECKVSHVTIFAQSCWAWWLALQGRLREARAECLEAIQVAKTVASSSALPTLSHVYSTLSSVMCEWNELEDAIHFSRLAVNLARQWEQADALHFALDTLGYALFASGDTDGAYETLQQAWQVARRTSPWFEEISLYQEVRWYLSRGNLDSAKHRLQMAGFDLDKLTTVQPQMSYSGIMPLIIIQAFLYLKWYNRALPAIKNLIEDAEQKNLGNMLIRLLIYQALGYQGINQEERALESLKHALELGEPEGYLLSFLDSGPEIISLLRKARLAGIRPGYIDRLLAAIPTELPPTGKPVKSSPHLIEPLSEREMEVLKLLAQGCTDKKIAERLVIASGTVHKHLKNIYGKLDVHNRTEAVSKARELSLI